MNLRPVFKAVPLVAALVVPAFAQSAANYEQGLIDFDNPGFQVYVPKTTISFGFRVLNSGAAVNFGKLGSVSMRADPLESDGSAWVYANGAVSRDAPRADLSRGEVQLDASGNYVRDANGNLIQTSTPGGRYTTSITIDGVTTITGDYLAYTPGQTRNWVYASDSQIVGNQVAMSNYGALSEGATARDEQSISSGIELQLARALSKADGRFSFSLTAGVALNDINAKAGGNVTSTLVSRTDFFQLIGGAAPTDTRGAPAFGPLTDSNGNLINSAGIETTVPLRDTPTAGMSTNSQVAGAAAVQGNWQLKGAYLMVRVGPTLRARLNERFGLSASLGVAGAYAGSRYTAVETLNLPDLLEPVVTTETSTRSKFLPGYYADLTLDWVANERTGLFWGVNMQNFGEYDQEVGGRTAKIDLGNAVGLRGGISVKF
jgi:hypothetical protein